MPNLSPEKTSSLLELLNSAEDIEVREVSLQNKQRILSSLDRFLRGSDDEDNDERAFVVRVRKRREPEPEPAPTEIPQDRAYLIASAETLLRNEDYVLARNIFSFLLKENLKDSAALRGLGICLLRLGESDAARKCFRAVWEQFQAEEALYWIAATHLKEGDDSLALQHMNRIQSPDTLPEEAQFNYYKDLGNCLTRANRFDHAISAYGKALSLRPGSSQIQANLGTLELQRGNLDFAQSHFEKALEADKKNGRAHCGLGILARAKSATGEAERHFERALENEPPNRIALLQIVEIAHHLQSYSKAKDLLTAYLEKHPSDAEMSYALAAIHFKESDLVLCHQRLDKALEVNPHHVKAARLKSELSGQKKKN
jgi:Flp pilus assembly protein TadD